ncbi:MAG TPA: thioredoxin family protein, partial [Tenericutes bacterium]|nr:thioredoxin family protein [Mycoplasmatota bacterium]
MKFKKIFIIILFIFLTIPFVSAKSEYDDIVADILGKEINSEKLTIYFFHGDGCPHCAKEEKFLKEIEAEYGEYVEIVKLEVWEDDENYSYLDIVKSKLNVSNKNVPFTVLGSNYYIGYSNTVKS